jgi:hypothetical protein
MKGSVLRSIEAWLEPKEVPSRLTFAACGVLPDGKTRPNTKDCLFWRLNASKVLSESGKVRVSIEPLES